MLDSEEAAIKELEKQYKKALKDINDKIKLFDTDIKQLQEAMNTDGLDEAAKAVLKSQQQAKVYQKQYQQALKGQISGVVDNLHTQQYSTIEAYLKDSYTNGFVGTMYSIHKQGIPLIMPIDQAAVVKAVLTDSKIVEGYYNHLGVNYAKLKKTITQEASRGIASGLSYSDIARNINNVSGSGLYNAKRIARTEGHRIQQTSSDDARQGAIKRGADLVKLWDAALDKRTRPSHARVDGEIREEGEKFSNGLLYPGDPNGGAAEVINCRCVATSRARWALDDTELQTLKERAVYFGLDKSKNFEDFSKNYLKSANNYSENPVGNIGNLQKYSTDLLSKHGVTVDVTEAGARLNAAKENIDLLGELLSEYNSTCVNYQFAASNMTEGGGAYMLNGKTSIQVARSSMRLNKATDSLKLGSNQHLGTTAHEFAHSLSQSREKIDPDFWKDLRKIRKEYKAEKNTTNWLKVKISDYADKDIDEFLAEAFTQAKLAENPSPYALKVLDVVEKYFKKPLENSAKGAIIKADNTTVRRWYIDQVSHITDSIDPSLPIAERARQAFEKRNSIRRQARDMMADEDIRKKLDKERPEKTFEELVESKMKRKGMTREEAIEDIYKTATKTNENVNKELGIEGE